MAKTVSMPIASLNVNLFVRKQLDQDHVLQFAELIENGERLPPIKVTPNGDVIDGRHRIEAHELNDLDVIQCELVEVRNETELITLAFKSNFGGPLPPSSADIDHTIELLIERKETNQSIASLLGLPPNIVRRIVGDVKSRQARAKLMRAITDVVDNGMTAPKSAEKHGIEVDKLKEALSGKRRKQKSGIADIQTSLTTIYKSLGSKNASIIKKTLEMFEDGDLSEQQVRDVFEHYDRLLKKSARAIADWEKRFDVQVSAPSLVAGSQF